MYNWHYASNEGMNTLEEVSIAQINALVGLSVSYRASPLQCFDLAVQRSECQFEAYHVKRYIIMSVGTELRIFI